MVFFSFIQSLIMIFLSQELEQEKRYQHVVSHSKSSSAHLRQICSQQQRGQIKRKLLAFSRGHLPLVFPENLSLLS